MNEPKLVTREELYEQVWSTPTQQLATRYGISDVALGKICKKLSVPKPAPGYWARVAAGYKPKKTRLPKSRPGQQTNVRITPSLAISTEIALDHGTLELIESLRQKEVVVPTTLERPHRLIRIARKHLRTRKPDMYGRIWPVEECIDTRISKASLNRGLLILNTIFRELEALGYRIYISSRRGATVLERGGVELSLALHERSNRAENPPPKKDAPWWSYERYSYEPSGELEITLARWPIGQSRWKDTGVRRLENRVKDIVCGILESTDLVRQEEARRARAEELRQQLALEHEERRRIEREEQERKKALIDQAAAWHVAEQLRGFISVAEVALHDQSEFEDQEIRSWVDWANEQANRMDPIVNGKLIQQIQVHSKVNPTRTDNRFG